MELYNKKYVYFEWDKNLEDKKGFVAQNIESLKNQVNDNPKGIVTLSSSDDNACPFTYYDVDDITCDYQFAYYDPDYEVKKAFFDGKTIQARFKINDRYHGSREWFDINKETLSEGYSLEDFDLRMKEEWKVYVQMYNDGPVFNISSSYCNTHCYFQGTYDDCKKYVSEHYNYPKMMYAWEHGETIQFKSISWEDIVNPAWDPRYEYRIKPKWYIILDDYGLSRTNSKRDEYVVFEGTEDECIKQMEKYKKFEDIMLACRQGKEIQYKEDDEWVDWRLDEIPSDSAFNKWKEWRIKDDVVESVPFDTVQELIDAWDEKYPQSANRPKGTMPLIWIKTKEKNRVYLITDFLFDKIYCGYDVGTEEENLKLKELFEEYTFLDGSIIGKVKEE